jgi:hypothetical protein
MLLDDVRLEVVRRPAHRLSRFQSAGSAQTAIRRYPAPTTHEYSSTGNATPRPTYTAPAIR